MNVLYFYLFLLVHPYLAMWWKSFEQADRKQWEALVPGYNYYVAFKLGAQKPFWSLLLIFPGVHIVMWAVVNVSYIRRFGYFSLVDTIQGIFFPYIIMYKIASSKDKMLPETNWASSIEVGRREWGDHLVLFLALPVIGHAIALGFSAVTRPKPGKKTKVKEWGDSIWFALIAALIIRTYVFEPFKIPTGSMENTLLVGDFLFVNKVAYGPKVPVTPFSYPLVHNTFPWIDTKSYIGIEKANYTRMWGYSDVERYDVVVFNYPAGDTAIYDPVMPNGLMGHNYHDYVNKEALRLWRESNSNYGKLKVMAAQDLRSEGYQNPSEALVIERANRLFDDLYYEDFIKNMYKWKHMAREFIAEGKTVVFENGLQVVREHYGVIERPVDKRENYIKRCVGVPGDWIELNNSKLIVNGKVAQTFENQLLRYHAPEFSLTSLSPYNLELGTSYFPNMPPEYGDSIPYTMMFLNKKDFAKLQRAFPDQEFKVHREEQYIDNPDQEPTGYEILENLSYFPNDVNVNNRVSDVQAFWIPKKGSTITLTAENIPYYRRIISVYEGHTLVEKDGKFIIDGKATTKYTFKMNYYWMMGDNRFNSADSRMWGFVPEDHIVGKASMVWMSSGNEGIRWDRIFMKIE